MWEVDRMALSLPAKVAFLILFFSVLAATVAIADETNQELEARALVKAVERVEYRSGVVAPVQVMKFREGDQFKKGDVLVELDCDKTLAEEQAANASVRAAEVELQKTRRLVRYQAAGRSELEVAKARAGEAKAQLEVLQVTNRSCVFKAPFDGRVAELNVRAFEYPPADAPMFVLIGDQALELELVLPSNWLVWLRAGNPFEVVIDETGAKGLGEISRIGAEVDPVSQTIEVSGRITKIEGLVLAGMSGTVRFNNGTH